MTKTRTSIWIYTLLGLVMLAGLTLRTWNVRWDAGMNPHPDERSTTCWPGGWIAWPDSWDEFLDPRQSPLNPLWNPVDQREFSFTYGHFPLYLGVLTGEVLHRLAPVADALPFPDRIVTMMERATEGCGGVAIPGRLSIALLDTLTIFFLFLLGRRIYGPWPGLLAATFYAFAAQAIQLSHFFAMDPASTTFTVFAVLGGVWMVQERSWRAAVLAGIGAGLAISSKFSALPILAVPVVAAGIVLWQERNTGEGRSALRVLLAAPLALLVAVLTFAVTSPYAILDWENFIRFTLVEQGAMVRGVADFPFTRQYRNTIPYLYFLQQQIEWGLWWPLGIVAALGTFWSLTRILAMVALPGELLAWAWLVPYFGLTGAFLAKFNRYMSPVLPFVLLFAAGLCWWLWRWMDDGRQTTDDSNGNPQSAIRNPQPAPRTTRYALRTLSVLLATVGVAGGIFWSLAYVNGVYGTPHPWVLAARWMAENVPAGSVVLCEQWDDCMPWGLPDEPEVNAANGQIRRIDWGPYEEDTAQKYEILRQKLLEADYVAYSSKRIYDSVDELPERYPMTTRYYDLMFSGELGFEIAYDVSTPPKLFGYTFPDQSADESWSLYDHPRVTIFRKVRDLSDAEFAQVLGNTWQSAIPYYRGEDSPIDPLLTALGLGSNPSSQSAGLINSVIAILRGEEPQPAPVAPPDDLTSLDLDTPLNQLPVVDDYRWNNQASQNTLLAVGWWWLVMAILGWLAWPIAFVLFRPLRDRGYLLSRALGWLLAGWILWVLAGVGVAHNTVINAWLAAALMGVLGLAALVWNWRQMVAFLRTSGPILLVGEAIFTVAYLFFVFVRMYNPDIWQPWFGGEKFMEFAFLNGILRSPTFPPVDPHFAGGFINYYYFGIYLVAYVIKLTGIYAEIAFNLAIPTLFALTVVNAFAVAYSAVIPAQRTVTRRTLPSPAATNGGSPTASRAIPVEAPPGGWDFSDYRSWGRAPLMNGPQTQARTAAVMSSAGGGGVDVLEIRMAGTLQGTPVIRHRVEASTATDAIGATASAIPWQRGIGPALLAPLFVAILGNLDAFAQIVRRLTAVSTLPFESAIPGVEGLVRALNGLWIVLTTDVQLAGYDFWGPSRVLPATINEFPYWSFTFADLHPHMIGIPFSVLFLGLVLTVLRRYGVDWRSHWRYDLLLLGAFSLLLGTLAAINLWELPTYFGLGVLALAVATFRGRGRIDLPLIVGFAVAYIAGAYLLFWPFFSNYQNVGASGVGLVRAPDDLGQWLLIWGFFVFVVIGWIVYAVTRPARRGDAQPTGLERWITATWRHIDRLPRLFALHGRLVRRPSVAYLLGQWLVPLLVVVALVAAWQGWTVLALCLPFLGISFLLLWRRGLAADAGSLFVALLTVTGFALLAGTQIVYLRDFLQGGDWYRMNTLFKFFIQVWVLWGVAAAIGVARVIWAEDGGRKTPLRTAVDEERSLLSSNEKAVAGNGRQTPKDALPTQHATRNTFSPIWRVAWLTGVVLLVLASLAYPIVGTPARSDQRFPGWRPELGTLDGLEFMRQGVYFWPDGNNPIEFGYDWQAIQWILGNVRGNFVIAESSEMDYYRAGGSRIASMTGLSGLNGKHASEQRYGEIVGPRSALFSEFWSTPDQNRTVQLIDELNIDLIYVGQLERFLHPQGVDKLARMAEQGLITQIYANDRSILYAVPNRLLRGGDDVYYPDPGA